MESEVLYGRIILHNKLPELESIINFDNHFLKLICIETDRNRDTGLGSLNLAQKIIQFGFFKS